MADFSESKRLYIIGYTCQCVVTKSAQSCLTNDPEQRPYFTIFDSAYNTIIFAVLPVYVTGTLMPKYGGAAASGNDKCSCRSFG